MAAVPSSHLCLLSHSPPSLELLYLHTPTFSASLPSVAISASLEATEARGNSLSPRGWGSRIWVLVRTYRGSNWPRTSWDSFRSSWSSGPWWTRGPRGTLDPCLSLFTLQFVKQELSAGRANTSHHHSKGPRQASLTEAEETEASLRLLP